MNPKIITPPPFQLEKAKFQWDKNKNETNIQKHQIDFKDIVNVFNNKYIVQPALCEKEARWLAIGKDSKKGKVFTIVFTIREKGQICRIISARCARKKEEAEYHNLY